MRRSIVLHLLALTIGVALPGAARAVCVGNCDNGPIVSIDEVQRCVNIFLGVQVIADCPNCNRDGNALVSIDEVQASVNSFLGNADTCPMVQSTPTAPPADATPTPTPTATEVATAEVTATATLPSTDTPTVVAPTETPTLAPPTDTPTETPTPLPTDTPTPSGTPTSTPTDTPTPLPTVTATVPLATATSTIPLPTLTPTLTPTPSFVCGNGVLEPGETCTTCPGDCVVRACTPMPTPPHTVTVNFNPPPGETVTGITALVGYRSDRASIPGSGGVTSVALRVKNKPSNSINSPFDLDYALREVISKSAGIPSGRIFTVDFDGCQGAATPISADYACTITGCSNLFGSVDGCSCSVVAQ